MPEENTYRAPSIWPQILSVVSILLISVGVLFALFKWNPFQFFNTDSEPEFALAPELQDDRANKPVPVEGMVTNLRDKLGANQNIILESRLTFSEVRTLTPDEVQILSRRAEFIIDKQAPPDLRFLTLEKFEEKMNLAQQRRKIYFSRKYKRQLKKLFKERYLAAQDAYVNGLYGEVRIELLNALVLPLFQNDIVKHRAVAQVMLRDYINDILGKVQALNAYVLMQGLSEALERLESGYNSIFSMVDNREWEEALDLSERLVVEAKQIERSAQAFQVPYPPIISQIDGDIRKGLDLQDEALAPISTSVNSVLADLKIKRSIFEVNTAVAIAASKAKYEEAIEALDEARWQDALELLTDIESPPEVAQDAQLKRAVIQELLALL